MITQLKDNTILVTGAGAGIGNELCKQLYAAGANVIALARSTAQLSELRQQCPNIHTIKVDLSDWQTTREALADVPTLDGLVNNAGIAIIKPFVELTEKDYDDQFNVNFKAVFNVTQTLLPKMKNGSSIVMVSSLAGQRSFQGHTVYSATKAALDSFTRSLALELGERKIRINSINPTVIMTKMSMNNWADPKKTEPLLAHIPLHRFGEVQEAVDGIVYLLGPFSSFVNGHQLPIEGGYSVS